MKTHEGKHLRTTSVLGLGVMHVISVSQLLLDIYSSELLLSFFFIFFNMMSNGNIIYT